MVYNLQRILADGGSKGVETLVKTGAPSPVVSFISDT